MAENKNLTVWQRLGVLFGPDKNPTITQRVPYSIDSKELIRTKSKEEYNTEKLQSQQNLYLRNQWDKVDNTLYQQAVFYETTRIASYTDFESMEFFPEISAALDILMEESTTQDGKGKILQIYSESDRVKRVLNDLFYNRLDIHTTLAMWTRNTCKYGDNFVYLDIDDKQGIVNCKQLPNIEIERHEGDVYNSINGVIDVERNRKKGDDLRFVWKNREFEFNSWQIAHFRLLGDDRRLPYGTSVLEKARRIYKQLLLSEDAMLIYRITRAPERRIFKIFVGNIDDKDVEPYVQQIANKFKRVPVVDPKTGQIDLRYNQMANDQDYFIPVRDTSTANPIETLAGASNLSEIADIEYLQKKLFAAIRVPKPFLGYESAVGDGKNLALQDVRFARTINRIQQAMLQELNKIAIIHLYILGLDEELNNFTLALNNPSTQAEVLKTEQLLQKMQLYKESVADAGNGFAAMSMTRAKKEILNMSNEEIRLDIEQQRLEKAAAAELANTANVIKKTGLFDKVDRLYGDVTGALAVGGEGAEGGATPPPTEPGGGFGGAEESIPPPETPEAGGTPPETTAESILGKEEKLLLERKDILNKEFKSKMVKYKENYMNKLIESLGPIDTKNVIKEDEDRVYNLNNKYNDEISDMMDNIDKLIK
jgi:hypothetical protein